MPKTHKNYPYVQKLVEEKNINELEKEKERIKRIIMEHKTALKWNLTDFFKKKIKKLIEHEEKVLSYIDKNLKNLKQNTKQPKPNVLP